MQESCFLAVYHALKAGGTARAADDGLFLHWLYSSRMQYERVIPSVYEIAKKLEEGPRTEERPH